MLRAVVRLGIDSVSLAWALLAPVGLLRPAARPILRLPLPSILSGQPLVTRAMRR